MTRKFIKLGRVGICLLITFISVLLSVFITITTMKVLGRGDMMLGLYISILAPLLITPILTWNIAGLLLRIHKLEQEQRHLATYDALTRLRVRRVFFEQLELAMKQSKQANTELAVAYIDIDHFKKINDSYGHNTGDVVLQQFAATLKQHFRDSDVIGRVGGEEFAVFLPQTAKLDAAELLDQLRQKIQSTSVECSEQQISYTISCGVTNFKNAASTRLDELIHQADVALYQAKISGRNRVEVYKPSFE